MLFSIRENHAWIQDSTKVISQVETTWLNIRFCTMFMADITPVWICSILVTYLQEVLSFEHIVDVRYVYATAIFNLLTRLNLLDTVHVVLKVVARLTEDGTVSIARCVKCSCDTCKTSDSESCSFIVCYHI